ncbi:MAG: Nif3-like dinuclear metal center hexameric protein [Epulopiscium sp.]|nr:Nif3-like dinuclear metal center hexameric protein [Candidatus Epulonipiscium sp.]
MSIKCNIIIKELNKLAPDGLAEEWDNVGLIIGDMEAEIHTILIALDAIPEVIDEAIKVKADLIITHHPLIFKPIKSIRKDMALGRSIYKLIQNNIGIYSAHTNLDSAFGGTNDTLAKILELENLSVLSENHLHSSNEEYIQGMGRIGTLKRTSTLKEYGELVKNKLGLSNIKLVGNESSIISKVAITTGSGMSYLKDAVNKKADLFITGDIKYHEAQQALEMGITLIDAGHYGTENIIVPVIKQYLKKLQNEHSGLNIKTSQINGDPFKVI